MMTRKLLLTAALCVLALWPATLRADDAAQIAIELNNVRQNKADCRISLVMRSTLPAHIKAMSLEVVLFNRQGRVDQFLKLKTGALANGKTRVKQFDLKGMNCSDLGKILINEIALCHGDGLSASSCLAALKTSSRTDVPLQL